MYLSPAANHERAPNLSERDTRSGSRSGDDPEVRAQNARSGFATLVRALGLLIAVSSAVAVISTGVGADVISGSAIGIALGFLGAGRLGVATIVVPVLAMFAGLLVNQLIPVVSATTASSPSSSPARATGKVFPAW